jgi:hypothetical protein
MIASPKVQNVTLDPYPREICFEVDINIFIGRKELMNPPSSNMRGRRRPNIWKESDENIVRTTLRYDSDMHQMEISHERDSLNSIK